MINIFLQEKFNIAIKKAHSKEYKQYISNQFYILNSLGIANEQELKKFHYISQYIPTCVKRVVGNSDKKICADVSKYVFANIKYEDLNDDNIKIQIINAFKQNGIIKKAYPIPHYDQEMLEHYDLNKWKETLQDIYLKQRVYGVGILEAVNHVTAQWSNMDEKRDFERWVNFYSKGNGSLYRTAQSAFPVQLPPGFPGHVPFVSKKDDFEMPLPANMNSIDTFELTRMKIIGRINSAKRLLTSKHGKQFAGRNYEKLLEMLLALEKDLYNIKTAAMLDDIVKRAIFAIEKSGVNESVTNVFKKIAQLPPLPGMPQTAPGGAPGAPGMAPDATAPADPKKAEEAINKFIENLTEVVPNETQNIEKPKFETAPDIGSDNKPLPGTTPPTAPQPPVVAKQSWVNINTPELKKFEKVANTILKIATETKNHFYVTGQAVAPLPLPTMPSPAKPTPITTVPTVMPAPANETTQVGEQAAQEDTRSKKQKMMDEPLVSVDSPSTAKLLNLQNDVIEQALQNISLKDVTDRLSALARVFKNREVARQLAIVDLMLDSLGISGFFPSLAEATRSALESNQYAQSRVEEILSKLMSATDEHGKSLIHNKKNDNNMVEREMGEYMKDNKEKDIKESMSPANDIQPLAPPAANIQQ